MGYPIVAVPILTLTLGLETAVAVIALPNMVANLLLVWETRSGAQGTRDLPVLLSFGTIGAVVGTLILQTVPQAPLIVVLVLTIAAFLVIFTLHPDRELTPEFTRRWAPVAGMVAGLMQGAIGVAGPVVATWMHGYRLARTPYVFACTVIFTVTGAVQAAVLLTGGAFTRDRLAGAAIAAVPMAIFLPLGAMVRRRLPQSSFDRVIVVVLGATAVSLVLRLFGLG
jgi:uncharacterized membrane protein YfcA